MEVSIFSRHIHFFSLLHQRFHFQAISYQILDRHIFAVFFGEYLQLRHVRAIVPSSFKISECGGRIQTCESAHINPMPPCVRHAPRRRDPAHIWAGYDLGRPKVSGVLVGSAKA